MTTTQFMIKLSADEYNALKKIALREWRLPREQALVLLRQSLIDAGVLSVEGQTTDPTPPPNPPGTA